MFGMFFKGAQQDLRGAIENVLEKGWVCPIRENNDSDYYSISRDEIVIRGRERFLDDSEYFGTLTHLMAHSVNCFEGKSILSTDRYVREEMVCECCSAMLLSMMGLEKTMNDDSRFYKKLMEKYWNNAGEREMIENEVKERFFAVLKALNGN